MTANQENVPAYSSRHRAMIRRLVPAWITEDFHPVADLLSSLRTAPPRTAWSPEGSSLPDERLRRIHDIWRAQAEGNEGPPERLCAPGAFGGLADVMMFLSFEADGEALRYQHYGSELAAHSGTNWTGKSTVDLVHYSEYSILFASSYLASAILREPLYNELVSAPKLVSTTWCRCLLPYTDEEGEVRAFACANLPMPGLPTWPAVEGRLRSSKPLVPAEGAEANDQAAALLMMESNVRDILTRSPGAVMVVAPEAGLVCFLNESMAALIGRDVDGMRAGDPRRAFAEGGDFDAAFAEVLAGKSLRDVETRLRRDEGPGAWTLMSAFRIIFNNNPCVAFWFHDISERKAAEEALREAELLQEETIRRLEESQAELRRQADRDALTNIPNRRFFYAFSAHEFERSLRFGSPLSLLMIDIDLFKNLNDEHGHQAGDEVLRKVAETLDGAKRRTDILARYGGEEFIVLLPETNAMGASTLAEKLREAVADAATEWGGRELRVTISLGVGSLREGDASIEALIKKADEALYEAKRLGRNRVAGG